MIKWSRELIDVSIANCTECRTILELFKIENSYNLILKAMSMIEAEKRKISGMAVSYTMFKTMMLNRRSSFADPGIDSRSFYLFGVPATTYHDYENDIFCNNMYFLCDFFDDNKSEVIKMRFKGVENG